MLSALAIAGLISAGVSIIGGGVSGWAGARDEENALNEQLENANLEAENLEIQLARQRETAAENQRLAQLQINELGRTRDKTLSSQRAQTGLMGIRTDSGSFQAVQEETSRIFNQNIQMSTDQTNLDYKNALAAIQQNENTLEDLYGDITDLEQETAWMEGPWNEILGAGAGAFSQVGGLINALGAAGIGV